MNERQLCDSDWAALRDAVPAFKVLWRNLVADATYDQKLPFLNIEELARFIAREVLAGRPGGLPTIARALEKLYTQAAIRDDESLEGLLTVGFLENVLLETEALGIPLVRIEPMFLGRRTREHWERAVTYLKPGFQWEDGIGLVASQPRMIPVGTVELHRGWADREASTLHLDVRLVAGTLRAGCLIRREITPDPYGEWPIASATLRSPDLPNAYHLEIAVDRAEMFEAFDLVMIRLAFWQRDTWEVARPASVPWKAPERVSREVLAESA